MCYHPLRRFLRCSSAAPAVSLRACGSGMLFDFAGMRTTTCTALYWSEHWPIRKIERHLHMGWDTIKKYLDMPAQTPAGRPRSSILDPFKATIAELLEKDPSASAAHGLHQPRPVTGSDSSRRRHPRSRN